jgi:hypothetical protein
MPYSYPETDLFRSPGQDAQSKNPSLALLLRRITSAPPRS